MPAPAFDNTFARLGEAFHSPVQPTRVAEPSLIAINRPLAESLGIDPDWLTSDEGLAMLSGNRLPDSAKPLAMAYAGHQFGHFVPQLGDGRALLLGELIDRQGQRQDVQLKGAGPTPFSRGGDGRSSIGPVVREYLGSEAMHALGIPTTRALAAVSTGEQVFRQRPEPGGILCRVARGHLRVGTFEYFARRGQVDDVDRLCRYALARFYPDADASQPGRALLEQVITAQAELVARWMLVGFIHGVMNTDNCSISGETIDFGPFGYLEEFRANTVYSSIDRQGRYAWQAQPGIAQWNLARLAECLLPLLNTDQSAALEEANALIHGFGEAFETRFHAGLAAKIGLVEGREGDAELALDLLKRMEANRVDFTLLFRGLCALSGQPDEADLAVRELFDDPKAFDQWAIQWRQRLAGEARSEQARQQAMRATNPAFILRNHLAQQAVDAAIDRLDFEPMRRLQSVLARPFDKQPDADDLARPASPQERVTQTFCGT
ncbi:MAG: protein adenylyltransferase SelO [Wenzhouxiangella sp.]